MITSMTLPSSLILRLGQVLLQAKGRVSGKIAASSHRPVMRSWAVANGISFSTARRIPHANG
jgi:hypothetical protein